MSYVLFVSANNFIVFLGKFSFNIVLGGGGCQVVCMGPRNFYQQPCLPVSDFEPDQDSVPVCLAAAEYSLSLDPILPLGGSLCF